MEFERIRIENDLKLADSLQTIEDGSAIDKLAPFAKAYLGMYYVISNDLAPVERVALLLNPPLLQAVFEGFDAVLESDDFPEATEIGHRHAKRQEFDIGYVVLAGLDYAINIQGRSFADFSAKLQAAAVCFYFANQTGQVNTWIDEVLTENDTNLHDAMDDFWQAIIEKGTGCLPGDWLVLGDRRNTSLTKKTILNLLRNWTGCRRRELRNMFYLGLQFGEHEALLNIAKQKIAEDKFRDEISRVYWQATRFVLEPELAGNDLAAFLGRAKIKVLPFLDYITGLLDEHKSIIDLSAETIVKVLNIVGPIFPPQYHIYGSLGELDVNSRNVMRLFYRLSTDTSDSVAQALQKLKKARVMKIYKPVIDYGLDMQMRLRNSENMPVPTFSDYISTLVNEDRLVTRSNRFDSK